MSEFSNLSSLKLLRSIDLLSRLTILQLSHIAESLSEFSFSDGQTIVNGVINFLLCHLWIYMKGQSVMKNLSFATFLLYKQHT